MEIKCPKEDILWMAYFNYKGEIIYIITSKPSRDVYFLYEVFDDGMCKKVGKACTPDELEKKFDIKSRL